MASHHQLHDIWSWRFSCSSWGMEKKSKPSRDCSARSGALLNASQRSGSKIDGRKINLWRLDDCQSRMTSVTFFPTDVMTVIKSVQMFGYCCSSSTRRRINQYNTAPHCRPLELCSRNEVSRSERDRRRRNEMGVGIQIPRSVFPMVCRPRILQSNLPALR